MEELRKYGYYFGTEIDEKWYHRFMAKGMLSRGNGKYWFDDKGLYFLRFLTTKPIFIPFSTVYDVKIGKWHSGRWGQGIDIIKILWSGYDRNLSSGFVFSKNNSEIQELVCFLNSKIENKDETEEV